MYRYVYSTYIYFKRSEVSVEAARLLLIKQDNSAKPVLFFNFKP